MAAKPLPSQEVLRQLLDYDPATGVLRWKLRGPEWFAPGKQTVTHQMRRWNSQYAGKISFTCVRDGYANGHLLNSATRAHRVAWKWVHGCDPCEIDHIDGDRLNNAVHNLRNVLGAENRRNRRIPKNNTTGVMGVERVRRRTGPDCWRVTIAGDYIGLFDCIGRAIAARREAERRRGFHLNHGRAA